MNSHNPDNEKKTREASLQRVLSNWAQKQHPPVFARARLLAAARAQKAMGPRFLWQLTERRNPPQKERGVPFSLFYAPQMGIVSAWINF